MEGGDSLYDKIDRGVRGCRVVLTMISPKYALSANCRREVSLADSLKKPIIPLLLDKMDWPPPGPMSMVFTQLLYIDFTKDPSIQLSWSGDKFEECVSNILEKAPELKKEVTFQKTANKSIYGIYMYIKTHLYKNLNHGYPQLYEGE